MDAYRGFVMLLMAGEMVRLGAVAAKMPEGSVWHLLAHHQEAENMLGMERNVGVYKEQMGEPRSQEFVGNIIATALQK